MKNFVYLLIAILFTFCSSPESNDQTPEGDYLFYNVNVITMENEQVLQNQAVAISKGKIQAIMPVTEVDSSKFKTIINATGQYLMPGLAEMHAHIPPPGDNDRIEETLFLYLSNGITTIRGMLGHPYHLELRNEVEEGNILGPRIYTSGPSLNGNTVQSVEAATQMVSEQKAAGYDFLKLHPGLKLDVFNEIVRTADSVGIDFAGHVSIDVGIRNALNANYASIDHVDGYLEGLVPESAGVDPTQNGFFGYNFAPLADMSLLDELIQSTKDNNVWVVTTQSLFTRWASPEPAATYLSQPEMKYMPVSTRNQWENSKNNIVSDDNYKAEQWEQMMDIRKETIKRLHDETDLILLGSDAPQVFNVPGFSIHHEIASLIDCGISNYDVLRTGTVNPAKFFNKTDEFGTITVGSVADLILLNGNPLENIANLQHPAGVMARGQWLDRTFIEQELERIAALNAE